MRPLRSANKRSRARRLDAPARLRRKPVYYKAVTPDIHNSPILVSLDEPLIRI